jgi:translation initiation factor 2D
MVMRKLQGGADLMTPGLANEPPFPKRATKGAVVTVASLDRHTVPLFVGICEIDVSALGEVQGTKGHAVRGLHWEGDELWAWSSSSRPGQPAPEYLPDWDEEEEEGDEESLGESAEAPSEEPAPVQEKEPSTKGRSLMNLVQAHKWLTMQRNRRGFR